ncbi:MAG: hypothetical protein KDA28_05175, partial [Phycisphaerales bacterium]|nr:hypothetical protein [Phycisphaerales bacterium]
MTDYSIRPSKSVDPYDLIRDRLRSLGFFVWRVDLSGLPLSEPDVEGLLGLFLKSGYLRQRVRTVVEGWAGEPPRYTALFPGCWVLPIPEKNRSLTTGYTICMAFSLEARDAPDLVEGCKAVNIDPGPMRRVLLDHDFAEAPLMDRIAAFAGWMIEDSLGHQSSTRVIGGFTSELTDAYETIDVLYTLGGSMHNVRQPEHFLRMSMNTVLTAMHYRWLAMVILDEPNVPES